MKIVSYRHHDHTGFGLVSADATRAIDASAAFGSLRAVLEKDRLPALAAWAHGRTPDIELAEVSFLSPVPEAKRIICIGRNFEKIHPIEGRIPPPEHISLFAKIAGSLVGHQQALQHPGCSDTFDYEGEIALIIGKRAARLTRAKAAEAIAGVTVLNDGSVREWQKHSVTAGKNFERASSIGPWMATMDEVGALEDLRLRTWLNGHKVQDVRAREMLFDIPALLEYVSGFTTLEPGDILSTGSPEREKVPGRESPYLQVGDTVDIEIDGVGRLSNTVAARP